MFAKVEPSFTKSATGVSLQLRFSELKLSDVKAEVLARIELANDKPGSAWGIQVNLTEGKYGIWEVRYPQLLLRPIGKDAAANRLLTPYRQGRLMKDPFMTSLNSKRIARATKYPSANGSMQFLALYNEKNRSGLYLSTHDSHYHSKDFNSDALPSESLIEYSVSQLPGDRGRQLQKYVSPYEAQVQPFQGEWHDAAQIYRAWLLKEPPFRHGPVALRKDIPQWLKDTGTVFQLKGSKLFDQIETTSAELVCGELEASFKKSREFFKDPSLLIFYNWRIGWDLKRTAMKLMDCLIYHGHTGVDFSKPLVD
jgi:hypothetical protein